MVKWRKEQQTTADPENQLDQRKTLKAIRESIAGLHQKFDGLALSQEKCTLDISQNYENIGQLQSDYRHPKAKVA